MSIGTKGTADLPLEVDDGSGETRIRNVAALDLVDGSGGIDVADVAANVRIRDGSGEIVAAVFAVPPLHVESVAWGSERKDTLSGLFFILSLLAYTR